MPDASLAGKLLVANPRLADPNFDRTVVLLLAHGEDGALGVVLNRPSATAVGEALPGWSALAAAPSMMFVGGPVSHESVIALARVPAPDGLAVLAGDDAWRPVVSDLGTLDLELDPDLVEGNVVSLRIFAGYAGWGGGQLESELLAGGWWVINSEPDDPFGPEPRDLWHDVLRRQAGELALVATYPPDPSLN